VYTGRFLKYTHPRFPLIMHLFKFRVLEFLNTYIKQNFYKSTNDILGLSFVDKSSFYKMKITFLLLGIGRKSDQISHFQFSEQLFSAIFRHFSLSGHFIDTNC